jgi:hypothetical protein
MRQREIIGRRVNCRTLRSAVCPRRQQLRGSVVNNAQLNGEPGLQKVRGDCCRFPGRDGGVTRLLNSYYLRGGRLGLIRSFLSVQKGTRDSSPKREQQDAA